jgi:hypothetical protein
LNEILDNLKAQIKTAVYLDWRKDFNNSDFDNATGYGYYSHNGEQVPSMKTFAQVRDETITAALQNINFNCATSTNYTLSDNSNFKISPNPTTDKIYLDFDYSVWNETLNYEIINWNGQIVQSGIVNNRMIDLENLNNGIFILKCFDAKNNFVVREIMVF